jgi:hypothetical protein
MASNGMIAELERIWKETTVANSMCYTVIFLEGLRRIMKRQPVF